MRELANWLNLGANAHTKITGLETELAQSLLAKV